MEIAKDVRGRYRVSDFNDFNAFVMDFGFKIFKVLMIMISMF